MTTDIESAPKAAGRSREEEGKGSPPALNSTTPSRWCAWCGKPVTIAVVVARTVVYHEFC